MSPITALLVFAALFLITAFLKMPIAFSMGFTCLGMIMIVGLPETSLAQTAFSSLDSFPYLAIPFFVFAGALMEHSGISSSLVNFLQSIIGRIRGSVGALTALACAAFGVLTGSTMATLSSIGKMMVPEMTKRKYPKDYAAALAAASSFLGILIPPSVPGIFYALTAGLNISKVWVSTIGPAILFIAGYLAINYWRVGRFEEKDREPFHVGRYAKNIAFSFKDALGALIMPIIIFGGIYGGIFTPTEAGAVCAVYGIIFLVIKMIRGFKPDMSIWKISVESAVMTAVISLVCAFSTAGGRILTMTGVSNALTEFITTNVHSPIAFLWFCNIIFIILGMLIDINASILIMTPLLLPSATLYGIDPIHFGAIMLVNLCVGYLTPPMAMSTFFICRIVDASFVDVVKESLPFIIWGFIVIVLTTHIPAISLLFV